MADFTAFEAALTDVQSSLSSADAREAAESGADQQTIDAATATLQQVKAHIDSFDPAATGSPVNAQPVGSVPTEAGPSNPPVVTDPTGASTATTGAATPPTDPAAPVVPASPAPSASDTPPSGAPQA